MTKTFSLTFHSMDVSPTKRSECLLYNQCDGYHLVTARFDDGEFLGFFDFMGTCPYSPEHFAGWAELPDANREVYETFADKRPFDRRSGEPA